MYNKHIYRERERTRERERDVCVFIYSQYTYIHIIYTKNRTKMGAFERIFTSFSAFCFSVAWAGLKNSDTKTAFPRLHVAGNWHHLN